MLNKEIYQMKAFICMKGVKFYDFMKKLKNFEILEH